MNYFEYDWLTCTSPSLEAPLVCAALKCYMHHIPCALFCTYTYYEILNKLQMQPMNVRIANVDIHIYVLLLSVCYQNAFHTLHVTKKRQNNAKGNSSNTPHILLLDFVSHDVWINNFGISFFNFIKNKLFWKNCSEWGLWQNKFSTCCSIFNEIIIVDLQTCLTSI